MKVSTIRAKVSNGILSKADRLFKNDDAGIWVELLQNARRAGATLIEVTIEPSSPGSEACLVTVKDNGGGIDNFQKLLTLGESGWDSATQAAEDPAGMGFYALCHSGIEVHSRDRAVVIGSDVFLGTAEAQVVKKDEFLAGTLLKFTRASSAKALETALKSVTEFYPVEVSLNGKVLPRHDFLEGALYREVIDGIEVGLGTRFDHAPNSSSYIDNWNFHGARIRDAFEFFTGLIDPLNPAATQTVFARFNVLETCRVRLQLPDRRAIIQGDSLASFYRKVRAAAYRFFQLQPQHALPYRNWAEARELGVALPEAAYLLSTWHAIPSDDDIDPLFEHSQRRLLADLSDVMLVDRNLSNQHTLEAALECGTKLRKSLWAEDSNLQGYSWYQKLPRVVDCEVFLDGVSYHKRQKTGVRPFKIEVSVTIGEFGRPDQEDRLPAIIHVDSETCNSVTFVAARNSPWDNDSLEGPFNVVDFLVWATFQSSDDYASDNWYRQKEDYEKAVTRQVNEYFRGPKASLLAMVKEAFDWDVRQLAERAGVTEIRLKLKKNGTENGMWDIELSAEEVSQRPS
jgi:hypothetical protein